MLAAGGAFPSEIKPLGLATGFTTAAERTAGPKLVGAAFGAPRTALRLLFANFLRGAFPAIQGRNPRPAPFSEPAVQGQRSCEGGSGGKEQVWAGP
mmetsp:Transcript_96892/g.207868  ORF Transcript_96892/g.207868 Transcript_96892/m.207868 type:complete len:96 (+) Transcript_96892:773-1060(+)